MKIAFGDRMNVGKDTCVQYLIEKYGGTKITIAEPLYQIMHFTQDLCNLKKEKDRHFLQIVGTEWGRSIDKNLWINIALSKAKNLNGNLFINDLRFPNELTALKDNGWICIKIVRTNPDKEHVSAHESEAGVDSDQWDYVIENNGSLAELFNQIDNICHSLYV